MLNPQGRVLVGVGAALLVLLTGCGNSPEVEEGAAENTQASLVLELADRYVDGYFEQYPTSATAEGIPDADLERLPDLTEQGLSSWHTLEDSLLSELTAVGFESLDSETRITAEFLLERLESSIGYRACSMELWNVSPTWTGWQSDLGFIASIQPVDSEVQRASALERARALGPYLEREIANLRVGQERGFSAPQNNVERVIEQMESLLAGEPADSAFADPARRAENDTFSTAMATVIEEVVDPAIESYREFLREEYLPNARVAIAVASNTDGEVCYSAAVRYHTSLDMTAQEVHDTGLEQMKQINAQMLEIGERSFGTTDIETLLARALSDPDYTFKDRQEVVDYAQAAIDRIQSGVSDWFGLTPEAEVVIMPYPAYREKSSPGAEYMGASDDGTRPATYFINTYRPTEQSKAGVEATAFHEAYPGHHLQISIAKERAESHPVQRYFGSSGFSEGWALYTERLADEMGAYGGDIDRLGLLSNEALRAGRLVVDSGMHSLGWTRQQAVDYLKANTAESPSSVEAEIDRYIAVPGQATAYMLGNLEIRRLRSRAEMELGEAFDIRSFHDRVLEDGAVTLSMLETKIERWLAAGATESTESTGGGH